MAMLQSAVGLALRHSASASRFCGKVGRRNPASNITTTCQSYGLILFTIEIYPTRENSSRNYDTSNMCEFSKEDFAGCTSVEYMIGAFACGIALVFRHYTTPPYEKESRYNTASSETKSNPDSQHGQHGREKTE